VHFGAIPHLKEISEARGEFTLRGDGEEFVTDVIRAISEHRIRITEFRTLLPTLEDVFLKLTGHSIRD